jgi:hypothetical protein
MKPTPHLIAAAAIVLVAAAICLPILLAGGGYFPIGGTVARVAVPSETVRPAATATAALVPAVDRTSEDNPFTLRKSGQKRALRISLPPPPPLEVPPPPLLPIPEGP